MPQYPEMAAAIADMRGQKEIYRPSAFWESASANLVTELSENGIERFRSLPIPLGFFVPTYGIPGNSFTAEQSSSLSDRFKSEFPKATKPALALDQFLSGEMSALADYRTLLGADDRKRLPRLDRFSEGNFGEPVEQFEFEGRRFSRSALNYLLGLALLKKHLGDDVPRVVLEIGGGFGSLGEVLASTGIPDVRYIDVDIPPVSFVAQSYLQASLGKENVRTYEQTREAGTINVASLPAATVICSWQLERLEGQVDLFVNFISFQEMEPHIVANYLAQVARLGARWILLRNMREGKQKRSPNSPVGVETPIESDDYLRMLPDYTLLERNVFPFGYKTVDGYHSELLVLKRK